MNGTRSALEGKTSTSMTTRASATVQKKYIQIRETLAPNLVGFSYHWSSMHLYWVTSVEVSGKEEVLKQEHKSFTRSGQSEVSDGEP